MTINYSKCFKALAHKNRLEIFEYLRKQELICSPAGEGSNVGDIAQQFDLALSTVSHHLKELYEAGLINCVQRGQFVCCTINHQTVAELQAFLAENEAPNPANPTPKKVTEGLVTEIRKGGEI